MSSRTWKHIHEKTGIGTSNGRQLILNDQDREALRKIVKNAINIDPQAINLNGPEMALAEQGAPEKLSNEAVFKRYIKIASSCTIETTQGIATTAPHSHLCVQYQHLRLNNVEHLILVENGTAFQHWHHIKLPKHYTQSVFVYRDHHHPASAVIDLFQQADCYKVGFYDYDIAGLLLGLRNTHLDALLLPRNQSNTFNICKEQDNQKSVFEKQFLEYSTRINTLSHKSRQLLEPIIANNLAIMQQHLISREVRLQEIKRSDWE